MHQRPGLRVAGVLLAASLAACSSGGGGDEDQPTRTQVSTNALRFSAASPSAATPASQTVTATFGENVANVGIIHTGPAIADVSWTVTGRTAVITVVPSTPSSNGAGLFEGAIAVTGYFCADAACSRVDAGNTERIAVDYQISPVVSYVTPYVGVAGVAGTAVIRGIGFGGFAIQGVRFGTTAATATAVVGATEILANYPALPAGTYPIGLDISCHEGPVPSTANLIVLDPIAQTAQTLAHPAATTVVRQLVYDAERAALLVATDANGGSVVRYPYAAGAWGAPATASIPALQDIALTTNGASVLALSTTRMTHLDPTSLTAGTAVDAPSLAANNFLKNLAVVNDNRAIVTTGIAASQATALYGYTVDTATFTLLSTTLNNATPGVAGNGALMGLVQGDPSLTAPPSFYTFVASSAAFAGTSLAINQNGIPPLLDRDATRLVLNGRTVYSLDLTLLGRLPDTTLAVALRQDGKRVYTYDSAAGGIMTFDISATNNSNPYPQLGATVPLAGDPGSAPRMIISADGATLFIAGSTQVVIQPTPAS